MAFASGTEEMDYNRPSVRPHRLHPTHSSGDREGTAATGPQQRLSRVPESSSVGLGTPYLPIPTPPPAAVSPVSRSDTTSAASTLYAVRYHQLNMTTAPVARPQPHQGGSTESRSSVTRSSQDDIEALNEKDPVQEINEKSAVEETTRIEAEQPKASESKGKWQALDMFKRKKAMPPAEVRQGQVIDPVAINTLGRQQPIHNYHPWDIKGRIGAFAAEQGERWRERGARQQADEDNLPVTIIPAQPRGHPRRPWSPDATKERELSSTESPSSKTGLFPPASLGLQSSGASSATPALSEGVHSERWGSAGGELIEVRLHAATPVPPESDVGEGPSQPRRSSP
jgi:hypothetical protein